MPVDPKSTFDRMIGPEDVPTTVGHFNCNLSTKVRGLEIDQDLLMSPSWFRSLVYRADLNARSAVITPAISRRRRGYREKPFEP